MTVSVVNGFLCFSSCEAATAAKGQNPHPYADVVSRRNADKLQHSSLNIIFGGTLQASGNGSAVG